MKNLQILFHKKKNNYHIHCKSNNWCLLMEMKENVSVVFVLFGFKAFQNGY